MVLTFEKKLFKVSSMKVIFMFCIVLIYQRTVFVFILRILFCDTLADETSTRSGIKDVCMQTNCSLYQTKYKTKKIWDDCQ